MTMRKRVEMIEFLCFLVGFDDFVYGCFWVLLHKCVSRDFGDVLVLMFSLVSCATGWWLLHRMFGWGWLVFG